MIAARRYERDHLVMVHRQRILLTGVGGVLRSEPVGEAPVDRGVVLAEIPTGQRGTALAGIVDTHQRKASVLGAGPQTRLAAARVPDHGDLRGIDVGIGLEVVHRPRARPGPRAEGAPGELLGFGVMLSIEGSYAGRGL